MDFKYDDKIPVLKDLGVGNIYIVLNNSTSAKSTYLIQKYKNKYYSDGSPVLHTTINSAVTACVGGRNDHILVSAGAYTLTTPIDLTGKSSIHLIGQNGDTCEVGSVGAAALTQTGNYPVVIMESYCELTGFQIINKAGYGAVTFASANSWRTSIHNNYFHMVNPGSSTTLVGSATGNANSHGIISKNVFRTYVGGAMQAVIGFDTGGAVDVIDNLIVHGTTQGAANYGIYNQTAYSVTMGNVVSNGGNGTINIGISSQLTGCVANNRVMGCTTAISGGTDEKSYSQNFSAAAGGSTALEA